MLNNNHKNPACAFAEPLISYLYGEIGGVEKVEFEAHLKSCADCSNELAELGFARTAVQEWRVEEFDKLATPIFEVPSNFVENPAVAANPRSWFSDWRQIFSFKPALALSAMAIVVALFGVSLFIFNFKSGNEIALKTTNEKIVKTSVSPTVEKIVQRPNDVAGNNADKAVASPENLPSKVADKKSVAPKSPTLKVSMNTPKNNSTGGAAIRVVQNTNRENKKPPAAPKSSKIPSLIDSPEEEDNSVRLADLFDEIGTR